MSSMEQSSFGKTPDGAPVGLFTLTNRHGHQIQMTNYGAILVSVVVPDRSGHLANINLGFPSLDGYFLRHPYFGATVGRFANRIVEGRFAIDGQEFRLATNLPPNHLHGGVVGFDRLVWEARELKPESGLGLRFQLQSPDGQEGYPGNLSVTADYLWNDDSRLTMVFTATTDRPTHVNLTNHAYFNLSGWKGGRIDDTLLELRCSRVLAVDEGLIPTGALLEVAGTPLDFRTPRKIGDRIDKLPATKGYDHCLVVDGVPGTLRLVGNAFDPRTGRGMEVMTTQPAVQLYTGNFLDGSASAGGFQQHEGFCLETQHYPDSPNHPEFPSTLIRPGQTSVQTTSMRFYVE